MQASENTLWYAQAVMNRLLIISTTPDTSRGRYVRVDGRKLRTFGIVTNVLTHERYEHDN